MTLRSLTYNVFGRAYLNLYTRNKPTRSKRYSIPLYKGKDSPLAYHYIKLLAVLNERLYNGPMPCMVVNKHSLRIYVETGFESHLGKVPN